jgi:hypothetical protein
MEASAHMNLNGHRQHEPAALNLKNDQRQISSSDIRDDSSPHPTLESLRDRSPDRLSLQQPSRDNCDRRRPQEEDNTRLKKMASQLVVKTVSPFLKEHIPGLYAPIGKENIKAGSKSPATWTRVKDPNTRYCYRHRPDSKCRRAADETKMGFIQSVSFLQCMTWLAGKMVADSFLFSFRNSTVSQTPIKRPSLTYGLYFLLRRRSSET